MRKLTFPLLTAVLLFSGATLPSQDPPPRMVKANGHRLSMLIEGKGSPTVVFEAGLGGVKKEWRRVQKEVAKFARTVAYDRAGLDQSEASSLPRTAHERALDLHKALQNAKLPPPYVLVGQSAGGPYIRVFASLYPQEVAGMVFVDASQEEFFDQLKTQLPADWRKYELLVSNALESNELSAAVRDELESFEGDLRMAGEAWPLPDVPVVTLTAMKHPEVSKEAMDLWLTSHESWTKRFSEGKHMRAENSGHNIQNEDPSIVVKAVREVVNRAYKR